MAIQHAINFLSDIDKDDALRRRFSLLKKEEIDVHLQQLGYAFTPDEFEEGINLLHVKCVHEEQAMHLFSLVQWYKMIRAEY